MDPGWRRIRLQQRCSECVYVCVSPCVSDGPAAVVKTGPGTEQPQRHTEPYCPYKDASVTPQQSPSVP